MKIIFFVDLAKKLPTWLFRGKKTKHFSFDRSISFQHFRICHPLKAKTLIKHRYFKIRSKLKYFENSFFLNDESNLCVIANNQRHCRDLSAVKNFSVLLRHASLAIFTQHIFATIPSNVELCDQTNCANASSKISKSNQMRLTWKYYSMRCCCLHF